MTEHFGPLLRKWRGLSDLTQKGLVSELRIAIERESYGKSDISKWERGNRIPPEDLVEELETILSVPEGVLLRAAGYRSTAEYKRLVAREESEKIDTEKEPLLKKQQKEHIRILQQKARSALDHLPDLPDFQNEPEVLFSFNYALIEVYRRLTGDDDWEDMAEHLGDQGAEIGMVSSILDEVLPVESNLDKFKEDLMEAWFLIKIRGLKTISESSDTRKWEWEGLNQRCNNCPHQEYEPVDIPS